MTLLARLEAELAAILRERDRLDQRARLLRPQITRLRLGEPESLVLARLEAERVEVGA